MRGILNQRRPMSIGSKVMLLRRRSYKIDAVKTVDGKQVGMSIINIGCLYENCFEEKYFL